MHALLCLDNFLTRIDYKRVQQEVVVNGKCETSIFQLQDRDFKERDFQVL